ncbi:lycopene beta-cyclase CrtY [Parvularcula marina]|uniref:Lycopene cyclase n=1 Tax=Parvularcula marina TaxID=2292771 RepID=A0A371RG09_9PROT|nr:lycopene beta-cyclase CrtY [Parvularcula marina]RFB04381.1 lycopene cyclase [Parvularcula marina]
MNASPLPDPENLDVVIVGGGLSGGLLAYRFKALMPELKVLLIEASDRLGGDHTWSFHDSDISPRALEWIRPFISSHWAGQTVRFPAYAREIGTGYNSVASARFDAVLREALGDAVMTGSPVEALSQDQVTLADGRTLRAHAVIDARGQRDYAHLALGFQKFAGLEIEFAEPHGLTRPIIMDATVPQLDGYRFVYTLPFTERTALVEDTYYADGDALDENAVETRIRDYCEQQGWKVARILRRESGILPIAMAGDIDAHLDEGMPGVASIGLAAGLFHPLTGYSLPDAVAMADRLAGADDVSGPALAALAREHAKETWEARGFYRLLSRLLFDAADPAKRYIVMQRFYQFSEGLIERFYAGQSSAGDKMRILAGKPPVPVSKAMKCLGEKQWLARRGMR